MLAAAESESNRPEVTNQPPTPTELGPGATQPALSRPGSSTIAKGWFEGGQSTVEGNAGYTDLTT